MNIKKYKITPLCSLNLVEIGWDKLGSKLEEERRWSKMIQDQEQLQIKEVVEYYIDKQKKRSIKLKEISVSDNKVMRWELHLRHARNNRKERLSYQ